MFGFSLVSLLGAYFGMLLIFFAIDFIWLAYIAKDMYRNGLGHLLLDTFKVAPAAIFYLMYLCGIIIFAVVPGVESGSLLKTMLLGGLFGFFCYATYDFTNWATLKDWSPFIVFADVIWGFFITSVTAGVGFYILNFLK